MTIKKKDAVCEPASQEEPKPEPPCRIIKAEELFGKSRQILIELKGALYTLRITRHNKLILHK